MTTSLYSPSWYRVSGLKPRLRSHVEIHRHIYRGETWYVLQDHASGKFQRFTPAAYLLIGLMDGRRTVEEIWEHGRASLGEGAPTQEEMIRLLSQLHAVDVMQSDVAPDTDELLKRFEKRSSRKWLQNVRNPMAMRFSLLDPERWLTRLQPLAAPFFGWFGALLWVSVVGTALFYVGVYWTELTENITDRVLAPQNLVLLWITFPFVKALHEFGHAFAVKVRGGEVHEMGIMLLVLTPTPYMDASSSLAFRSKWERILVGAAGMAVELFIAAIALFLWIHTQPGAMRAVFYNIIFIAGVSSLLFNGNPLLRYDAYYMLTDLLEIPNLGSRGLRYIGYLMQRYVFGIPGAEPPLSSPGERAWFIIYSIASFAYRIFIYFSIVFFIAAKFFIAGVLLAGWAVISMFILPLGRSMKFLFSSPRLQKKRVRAFLATALIAAALGAVVFWIPVPLSTRAEGVIWVPEQAHVRAGTDGFVETLKVAPGARVKVGDPIIECSDPLLPAQIRVEEAQLRELQVQYDTQILSDRVKAEITKDELRNIEGQLARSRERFAALTICSLAAGNFLSPMAQDLPGKFVKRGELLGYILDRATITARVAVSQEDVDFVRHKTQGVKIRFPERIMEAVPAAIRREVPAATDRLPSRTLGQPGGGEIPIDPRDNQGIKAFQSVFLFDIELPEAKLYPVEGRVYVRFDHGWEPLIWRWYRSVRQLFLKRFNV